MNFLYDHLMHSIFYNAVQEMFCSIFTYLHLLLELVFTVIMGESHEVLTE